MMRSVVKTDEKLPRVYAWADHQGALRRAKARDGLITVDTEGRRRGFFMRTLRRKGLPIMATAINGVDHVEDQPTALLPPEQQPPQVGSCYRIGISKKFDEPDWFPSSLESLPPSARNLELLPDSSDLSTLLEKCRQMNREFLNTRPITQWAAVIFLDAAHKRTVLNWDRLVTPLVYCSLMVHVPSDWRPRHLLDTPPQEWKFTILTGDYSRGSFVEMLNETISGNRFSVKRMDDREDYHHWHVLVVIEHETVTGETAFMSQGIVTEQSISKFRVITPDNWQIPASIDLALTSKDVDYDESEVVFDVYYHNDDWFQILKIDADGHQMQGPLVQRNQLQRGEFLRQFESDGSRAVAYPVRVEAMVIGDAISSD